MKTALELPTSDRSQSILACSVSGRPAPTASNATRRRPNASGTAPGHRPLPPNTQHLHLIVRLPDVGDELAHAFAQSPVMKRLHRNLVAVLEVLLEHLVHLLSEGPVEEGQALLRVAVHRTGVEIDRA